MPASPVLVLVDPRAHKRALQRAAVRQRVAAYAVGLGIAVACAVPYALTSGR